MRNSLRFRLTAIFIGLAIGPLLLVGAVLTQRSLTIQRAQALDLQRYVALHVSTQVNAFIQERENELRVISETRNLLGLNRKEQANLLSGLLYYQDVYKELVLLDHEGQEQVRVSRLSPITTADLGNRAGADEFVVPKSSGETYYSPVWFDEVTSEPFMAIVIPLFDLRTGTVDGVLMADFRFKTVWDLIADVQLSEGESIYVVDEQGRIVAHRNPSVVLQGTNFDLPDQDGIHTGLSGREVVLAIDRVQLGEQTLTVVAEKATSKAFELAINTVYITSGVVVLVLVIAVGAGVLTVRRIVQPIERLATVARSIMAGDLSRQAEVTSGDEIGALAEAFNNMTARLRQSLEDLEQRVVDLTRAEERLKEYSERLEEIVKERTQELRDAQEELIRKEKLATLGQLAGGVAHELRNPLGAIKNSAYFLNTVLDETDPEVQEALQILNREVDNSDRIITSLLNYARPKEPAPRSVGLSPLLQETLAHQPIPEHIEVETQFDETLPPVIADPDQLGLVFGNLIHNAIQAMPDEGRLVITSEIISEGSSSDHPTWVAVSIADTGEGIPQENLKKLFEPLFTTKTKGIGLGLALVKSLVEVNGGTIEVESEVGKGSIFTVRLLARGKK
jgi:signal transduction histidine kinase